MTIKLKIRLVARIPSKASVVLKVASQGNRKVDEAVFNNQVASRTFSSSLNKCLGASKVNAAVQSRREKMFRGKKAKTLRLTLILTS